MGDTWVLNASPVIVLARIAHADLITDLAEAAVMPAAVATEIEAGPEDDPARHWLASGAIRVVATSSPPPELLAWDLGAGETAVLAYAIATPGAVAILDDASARRAFQCRSKERWRLSCWPGSAA